MASRRRVLGCGCGGCLALPLLALLLLGVTLLLARADPPEPRPTTVEREHDAPRPPAPPAQGEPRLEAGPRELGTAATVGRIDLDLEGVALEVVPVTAGRPLRITGDYDASLFDLEEGFERSPDGGWSYRVEMAPRSLLAMAARGGSVRAPQLRLELPEDLPAELAGRLRLGSYRLELGGLALRSVDLDLGAGDNRVSFSRPTPRPLTSLRVEARMGDTSVRGVGNASPGSTRVSQGLGSLLLDLSGPWRGDGSVDVSLGMGELDVRLPEGVQVELHERGPGLGSRRVAPPPEAPPGAPRLRVDARSSVGELVVH